VLVGILTPLFHCLDSFLECAWYIRAGRESGRVGCSGATNSRGLCHFYFSMGACKRGKEDTRGRELIYVASYGKIGRRLRCDLYILLSLLLVEPNREEKE